MKKRKWLITALGIGLICGMLLNGCAGKNEESQSSDTKQENMSKPVSEQAEPQSSVEQEQSPQQTDSEQEGLKSFTATTLDGSTISQEEIKEKDVTIIHFWATTCGPCIVEMPDLAEFADSLPENVQLITVCLDGLFDMEGAKSIVDEAGFQGITLITGEGDFQKICEGCSIRRRQLQLIRRELLLAIPSSAVSKIWQKRIPMRSMWFCSQWERRK